MNLATLYEELFRKKVDYIRYKTNPTRMMGFLGQRENPARLSRKQTMKALGIKTGKAYRRYEKRIRRENREENAHLSKAA